MVIEIGFICNFLKRRGKVKKYLIAGTEGSNLYHPFHK
jgi:hypothetical protein